MFIYLFKCRLICLFRQKSLFLFSIGLPILLALIFFIVLNNMSEKENSVIRLGILGDEASITEYFKGIITDDGTSLFEMIPTNEVEGEELLKQGNIKGLLQTGVMPVLYVLEKGPEQSIINYYVTKFGWLRNREKALTSQGTIAEVLETRDNNVLVNRGDTVLPDKALIFFYNLIVLTLLMGAKLGFNEVKFILQEQSSVGIRIMTAPRSRSGICFINLAAAFSIHLAGAALCQTFIIKILKIDLLIPILPLIVINLITSILGFSLGIFICIIIKANTKVQSTILNLILILGSISAGLFDANIKYFILERAPLFRFINPFILVFDTIYNSISYNEFYQSNISPLVLIIITLGLTIYSILFICRRDYAGI